MKDRHERDHLIISVHGIRDFGSWQDRLERLLLRRASDFQKNPDDIEVRSFKFGYFSLIAFLLPFARWWITRKYSKMLSQVAREGHWRRIDLVGHSFGTHVLSYGMLRCPEEERPNINTIILAGSVLRSDFPWQRMLGKNIARVVNDCGAKDWVLLLSQFFVLFTGMAGRTGFSGALNHNFRNRFSMFGHGGYFDLDENESPAYMERYWLPILLSEDDIETWPDPRPTGVISGLLATLSDNAEPVKLGIYLALFGTLGYWLYQGYLSGVREDIASSRQLAARAEFLKETSFDSSLLLASHAFQTYPTQEARRALSSVLQHKPYFEGFVRPTTSSANRVVYVGSNRIAYGRSDGVVVIFDISDRKIVSESKVSESSIRGIVTSEDTSLIAVLDDKEILSILRTETLKSIGSVKVGFGGFLSVDFDFGSAGVAYKPAPIAFADSDRILYAEESRPVLYDISDERVIARFDSDTESDGDARPGAVAWNPEARQVAAIQNGAVNVWELDHSDNPTWVIPENNASDLAFTALGRMVVARGNGAAVYSPEFEKIWEGDLHDVSSDHVTAHKSREVVVVTGHESGFDAGASDPSAAILDIGMLISKAQTISQDTAFPKVYLTGKHPFSLDFSPLDQFATTTDSGSIELWSTASPSVLLTTVNLSNASEIRPNPRENTLYVLAEDKLFVVNHEGRILRSIESKQPEGIPQKIRSFATHEEELAILVGDEIQILDADTTNVVARTSGVPGDTLRGPLAFDDDWIVAASGTEVDWGSDVHATVWNRDDASLIPRRLDTPSSPQSITNFALDSKRSMLFAGTTYAGIVTSWNLSQPGEPRTVLYGLDPEVGGLALSGDGSWLYSAHSNGRIVATDFSQETLRILIPTGLDQYPKLAISTNAERIAVSAQDERITIWDAKSGISTSTALSRGTNACDLCYGIGTTSIAFFPDGQSIGIAYGDGSFGIWDLSAEEWSSRAEMLAGRTLSEEDINGAQFASTGEEATDDEPGAHDSETCFVGFVDRLFEPTKCLPNLVTLLQSAANQPSMRSCSAYASVLQTEPLLLSGDQLDWAWRTVERRESSMSAAIIMIGLTGETSEIERLEHLRTGLDLTDGELTAIDWAIKFLTTHGRDTRVKAILDSSRADYARFLSWPSCVDKDVNWDRLRENQVWVAPEHGAKMDERGRFASLAYAHIQLGRPDTLLNSLYAELLVDAGNARDGIEIFRRLLETEPTNAHVHHVLANSLRSNGDNEGAIKHYELSLHHGRNDGWPQIQLARMARERGNYSLATRLFEEAISIDREPRSKRERADFFAEFSEHLVQHEESVKKARELLVRGVIVTGASYSKALEALAQHDFSSGAFIDALAHQSAAAQIGRDTETSEQLLQNFKEAIQLGIELPAEEPIANSDLRWNDDPKSACLRSTVLLRPRGELWIPDLSDKWYDNPSLEVCKSRIPDDRISGLRRAVWEGLSQGDRFVCSCNTE